MNKITIYTTYRIEHTDGSYTTYNADTNSKAYKDTEELKSILDLQTEKVGAIERKLLKSHE